MSECFAPIRGSGLRLTALDSRGRLIDAAPFAVSKAVASVQIREVVEQGRDDLMKNPEEERRLKIITAPKTIRNEVDISFLRVDPGVLSLVTGVPTVLNASGAIVGFDSNTAEVRTSFALEVWSKLAGRRCAISAEDPGFGMGAFGEDPFGGSNEGFPLWGYTLFPFLRGGRVSGFTFTNGLVSFNLIGARTMRGSGWAVGPYDLEGFQQRLTQPVSRNTMWRILTTPAPPPAQVDGVQPGVLDVVSNGTPANPMPYPDHPLVVNGGTPASAGPYIISGGRP